MLSPRMGDLGCSLTAAVMALVVVALLIVSSATVFADDWVVGYRGEGGFFIVGSSQGPRYNPLQPRYPMHGYQTYTPPPAHNPRDQNRQLARWNRILYWEDKVREEAREAQEAYARWQRLRATWDGSNAGQRRINSAQIRFNNEAGDVRRAQERLYEARAGR